MNSKVKTERYTKIVEILAILDLASDHVNILSHHNPSRNAPYHNTEHCFTVAINSYKVAQYYALSLEDTQALFLAALYHDFDHSADSTVSDIVNIERAINGLEKWLRKFKEENLLSFASSILEGTVYPHHLFVGERNFLQQIICDADSMQWLEEDAEQFMVGLSAEKGCLVDLVSTRKFLSQHIFFTDFGLQAQQSYLLNTA